MVAARNEFAGMKEWVEVAIGDLIDIDHGYAFKGQSIHDDPQDQSDILLTPGNFAIGGGFKGDKFKYYDGDAPEGFVLHSNDLLVTMTDLSKESDTLGYPALVPSRTDNRRYLHNQRLGKIKLKETNDVDFRYLYYVMCSRDYRNEILASCTGTTVKHTSPERIKQYRFLLPPKEEQEAIAHVLGTLDDKIELNRRMNRTLEEMARAIFQDWFVDFGPTRAKMEGQEPYFPPELWDQFPDELADSEIGEIPEGWDIKPLNRCIDVAKGLSYKGAGLAPEGTPMHNLNSVYEGGGYKDDGIKYYIGDYRERHLIRPGDAIVPNTEQGHDRLLIGFAAIVPRRFGDYGLFSHHLYRVRPNPSSTLTADFICHLLNTRPMHNTVSGYATGTTVNMLPTDALSLPRAVIPTEHTIAVFSRMSESARARQENLMKETLALIEQRNNLIPKLVSGELQISWGSYYFETP